VNQSQFSEYGCLNVGATPLKAMPQKKGIIMRKKCFDEEAVFAHLWNNADPDGLWDGDATTLAAAFEVPEREADDILGKLCDRGLIQPVGTETYVITRWPEKNESAEKDLSWWEISVLRK
jgi:hypothetical protein